MILVDTSVWIDFFKGENSPERWTLHRLIQDEKEISISGLKILVLPIEHNRPPLF